MASISWENKYKGGTETKAHFRHNEKEERMKIKEPQNYHIDPTRTHLNYSIANRSYAERCKMYDEAVAAAEQMSHTETYVVKKGKHAGETRTRTKTGMNKNTVTCLGLETPIPADLPEDKISAWAKRYHEILCDAFGAENVIDTDVHLDEIHDYYDPVKKCYETSRIHLHSGILPRASDGHFCCRDIATRENIIKLNDRVEKMSQEEFGVQFNTGEEPRREPVEVLKAKSAAAELEQKQNEISLLSETMEKAPKQERKGFLGFQKTENYVIDKKQYDGYMQAAEDMRSYSHNTVTSDKDRQEAEEAKKAAYQMKKQQEQLIQNKAQELAQQLVSSRVAALDKARREAEEEKRLAEEEKTKYAELCSKEKAYIRGTAQKIADKVCAPFAALEAKNKALRIRETIEREGWDSFSDVKDDYGLSK